MWSNERRAREAKIQQIIYRVRKFRLHPSTCKPNNTGWIMSQLWFKCPSLPLILPPFHKPCSCFPSLSLPLYLLVGGPRLGRGGRGGGGNACCFLIIIGVFMVILLLIKVLRQMEGTRKREEERMKRSLDFHREDERGFRGHVGINEG